MSGFEVLFSFYGLLLGLAVANVTSGFADAWRRRSDWTLGIAPVLLGLLVLFAAAQQWGSFWAGRDMLTMGPWEMLTSMAMALPYIFISQAMFPVNLEEGGSLEAHYLRQAPVLMSVLLIPPVVSLAYNIAFSPPPPRVFDYLYFALYGLPQLLIPAVLIWWRNPWAHRIGLALICAWLLFKLFS